MEFFDILTSEKAQNFVKYILQLMNVKGDITFFRNAITSLQHDENESDIRTAVSTVVASPIGREYTNGRKEPIIETKKLAAPISTEQLSVAVNREIQTVESSFRAFIVKIFPHYTCATILESIHLTCKIYFANDLSSDEIQVPQTANGHATLNLFLPNYGTPEKIVIRQAIVTPKDVLFWLLDSVTGKETLY